MLTLSIAVPADLFAPVSTALSATVCAAILAAFPAESLREVRSRLRRRTGVTDRAVGKSLGKSSGHGKIDEQNSETDWRIWQQISRAKCCGDVQHHEDVDGIKIRDTHTVCDLQ